MAPDGDERLASRSSPPHPAEISYGTHSIVSVTPTAVRCRTAYPARVLKEGTPIHIQSAVGLGTWHALRTFLSSAITEEAICNSFDKRVIINYEIMTLIIIRHTRNAQAMMRYSSTKPRH